MTHPAHFSRPAGAARNPGSPCTLASYALALAALFLAVKPAAAHGARPRASRGSPEEPREARTLGLAQADSPGEQRISTHFTGRVLDPRGAPAEGALVVSSAGGRAVAGADGSFELEIPLAPEVQRLQVTAVAGSGATAGVASSTVPISRRGALHAVGTLRLQSEGACQPSWLPTFGGEPGVNSTVTALLAFDDGGGGGPALYVGGVFTSAGGVPAHGVARWNGTSWSALGSGMNGYVFALAEFDDGGAPALYAAGSFTTAGGLPASGIARWNGVAWSPLEGGTNGEIRALAVLDDGSGAGMALYAGGYFTSAGGVSTARIARWNGTSWSALGSGLDRAAFALSVFDDGSGAGPQLYAGGDFTSAGGVAASRIARWDGTAWSPLASGMNDIVFSLGVFDDGSGNGTALFAGGTFTTAGGAAAVRIARWDGASWSPLGSGMNHTVYAFSVFDDGSGGGALLHAAGDFTSAGGVAARRVASWNGATWSPLGSGFESSETVYALAAFAAGGAGPRLYAGGYFRSAGGVVASRIAQWNGASWSAIGTGLSDRVSALATSVDGDVLYAGGIFKSAGGAALERIARWDGTSWSALGSGVSGGSFVEVFSLAVFDDGLGSGPCLYVGGNFAAAGGIPASRIARWDGASWSSVGGGVSGSSNVSVNALAVFDDGTGPGLYAAGWFTSAGGVSANRIARWDGTSWSALSNGVGSAVNAMLVFDDGLGGGSALYVAGSLLSAGGVPASRIARWDGTSWSALGAGIDGNPVLALAAFDDGTGTGRCLYAGGNFTSAGGSSANRIARWDGASWSPVGGGMNDVVRALSVFDDGTGEALYAGGDFTSAGGTAASRLARWDGTTWSPLGGGVNDRVHALTAFGAGSGDGPALHAGGDFSSALDSADSFLAKWTGCPDTLAPTLACPTSVSVTDRLANGPGEVVFFSVVASDDSDPSPDVVCSPPSGTLFPGGTTIVACTATDASGNQSTCTFPVVVTPKVREKRL